VCNFITVVGNFTTLICNFRATVGNFTTMMCNYTSVVGNFTTLVCNFTSVVGNFITYVLRAPTWASSGARCCDAMLGNAGVGGGVGDLTHMARILEGNACDPRATIWGQH
jgi:hypothetical protein